MRTEGERRPCGLDSSFILKLGNIEQKRCMIRDCLYTYVLIPVDLCSLFCLLIAEYKQHSRIAIKDSSPSMNSTFKKFIYFKCL